MPYTTIVKDLNVRCFKAGIKPGAICTQRLREIIFDDYNRILLGKAIGAAVCILAIGGILITPLALLICMTAGAIGSITYAPIAALIEHEREKIIVPKPRLL